MRVNQARARNFRNFELLDAHFSGGAHFICGANGQGKTNLLEGIALLTTLRSFRAAEQSALVRWDADPPIASLVFALDHDQLGETSVEIHLRNNGKTILLDGEPVKRMAEILGKFPTVTFSSQDIQILRGTPSLRRRVLDLMFVSMQPAYYGNLQRYFKALKARNSLLKQGAAESHMAPFEEILINEGWELVQLRRKLLSEFMPYFQTAYSGISGIDEQPDLSLSTSPAESLESYRELFAKRARRDRDMGSTSIGPHRDDLEIQLQNHPAREFASEGQQRGLVLSIRMGLVKWYREHGSTAPIILADDIVGELDAMRRRGFWEMLGTESQIFATGTHKPVEDTYHKWTDWQMESGSLIPVGKGADK